MYKTTQEAARITAVMSMNQLNSNEPMLTRNACFAPPYWMMEETSSGLEAVLIALTITVAAAVPSIFSAVPTMVWSALKLMQATASSAEYSIPITTAARITTRIIRNAGESAGIYRMASAPPSAPMIMMPSRPRLITPECSEMQPPSATRIRTEAKISVY